MHLDGKAMRTPTPPEVAFVEMHGDSPRKHVNWSDPTARWTPFLWNFVRGTMRLAFLNNYTGRPTGIAVGSHGSLFVADDDNGVIYRIRPAAVAVSRQPCAPRLTARDDVWRALLPDPIPDTSGRSTDPTL